MDLQLRGKTALVTGASVGLGRCMAQMLAREGCELAIVARRESLLNSLAEEIHAEGWAKPLVIVCDIMGKEAPQQIHEQAPRVIGWEGIDGASNASGQEIGQNNIFETGVGMLHSLARSLLNKLKHGHLFQSEKENRPHCIRLEARTSGRQAQCREHRAALEVPHRH